jgi:Uma2 family endonuclease
VVTVVLDPYAFELDTLRERRRVSGLDRLDEVWEDVLHMVPAPSYAHASVEAQLTRLLGPYADAAGLELIGQSNLGETEHDFRVPDGAMHRPGASGTWHPTAALVIEIVSPDDESWKKLPFYAAHDVDEILIVDPQTCVVHWLVLTDNGDDYHPIQRSNLIDLGPEQLAERIDWPR